MKHSFFTHTLIAAGMAAALLGSCSKIPTFVGGKGGDVEHGGAETASAFRYTLSFTPGYSTADDVQTAPKASITVKGEDTEALYSLDDIVVKDPDGETRKPTAFKSILDDTPRDISRVFKDCLKRGRYGITATLSRESDGEKVAIDTAVWVKGPSLTTVAFDLLTPDGDYVGKDSWKAYQDTEVTLRVTWSPAKTICALTFKTGIGVMTVPTKTVEVGGGEYLVPVEVTGEGGGSITAVLENGDEVTEQTRSVTCIYDEAHSYAAEINVSCQKQITYGDNLPVTVTLTKGRTDSKYLVKLRVDGKEVLSQNNVDLSSPAKLSPLVLVEAGDHELVAEVSRSDGKGGKATASSTFNMRMPVKVSSIAVSRTLTLNCDGSAERLPFTVSPSNADDKTVDVNMVTGDAVVSAAIEGGNLVVTPKGKPGTARIRLSAHDGGGVEALVDVEARRWVSLGVSLREDSKNKMNPAACGRCFLVINYNPSLLASDAKVVMEVFAVLSEKGYKTKTVSVILKKGTGTEASVDVMDVAGELVWPYIFDIDQLQCLGMSIQAGQTWPLMDFELEKQINHSCVFYTYFTEIDC